MTKEIMVGMYFTKQTKILPYFLKIYWHSFKGSNSAIIMKGIIVSAKKEIILIIKNHFILNHQVMQICNSFQLFDII